MEIASEAERNPHVGLGLGRTWSVYFHVRSVNTGACSGTLSPPGSASSRGKCQTPRHQNGTTTKKKDFLGFTFFFPRLPLVHPSTYTDPERRSPTLRMKFFTSWLSEIVCPAVMLAARRLMQTGGGRAERAEVGMQNQGREGESGGG